MKNNESEEWFKKPVSMDSERGIKEAKDVVRDCWDAISLSTSTKVLKFFFSYFILLSFEECFFFLKTTVEKYKY